MQHVKQVEELHVLVGHRRAAQPNPKLALRRQRCARTGSDSCSIVHVRQCELIRSCRIKETSLHFSVRIDRNALVPYLCDAGFVMAWHSSTTNPPNKCFEDEEADTDSLRNTVWKVESNEWPMSSTLIVGAYKVEMRAAVENCYVWQS